MQQNENDYATASQGFAFSLNGNQNKKRQIRDREKKLG